jgi:uncharacterized protein YbcI
MSVHTKVAEEPAGSPVLQISNSIGRIHKEFVGRGPDRVRTYVDDDLVVCILEGGFTRAEQSVREHVGETTVLELRVQLQEAMKLAMIDAVEGILGRRVRSFMSANDFDANVQVEVLLLDAPAG